MKHRSGIAEMQPIEVSITALIVNPFMNLYWKMLSLRHISCWQEALMM